jgi:hypothetical protein
MIWDANNSGIIKLIMEGRGLALGAESGMNDMNGNDYDQHGLGYQVAYDICIAFGPH